MASRSSWTRASRDSALENSPSSKTLGGMLAALGRGSCSGTSPCLPRRATRATFQSPAWMRAWERSAASYEWLASSGQGAQRASISLGRPSMSRQEA